MNDPIFGASLEVNTSRNDFKRLRIAMLIGDTTEEINGTRITKTRIRSFHTQTTQTKRENARFHRFQDQNRKRAPRDSWTIIKKISY